MKAGELVKSKLPQHLQLTTWRIVEIERGLSGKVRYFCEASHDTKKSYGFDNIKYEFTEDEICLI